MARLVIYSSGVVNRTVELAGQNIRIGRAEGNDVVLADPAQVVSRFHAELRFEDGRYTLLDLNSANGTWVLDHRIQRIVFDTGTVAEIGDYRLVLEADPEETTAPPNTRLKIEPRSAPVSKAASGTLVISALPQSTEPPSSAVQAPPPQSTEPPAPAVHAPLPPPGPAALAPASPAPPPLVAPVAAPASTHSGVPPSASAPPRAGAPPTGLAAGVRRAGASGPARPIAGAAGRPAVRLSGQPRALVVSVVALAVLVVGVIALIVGGEFLLSPGEEATGRQENQLRAAPGAAAPVAVESPPASGPPPEVTAPPPAPPVPAASGLAGAAVPNTLPPPPLSRPVRSSRSEGGIAPAPAPPAGARPGTFVAPAGLARRVGESQADFMVRAQRLQGMYGEAVAAQQARDYTGAIALFERLEAEQSGLLDVPARLAESREELRESKRAAAQAALAAGAAAEQRGDLVEAQKEFQRALEADPDCGAGEPLRRVRAQMKTLGDAAFKRAKTFDALSRTEDAIAQYERAVQLLPPDDPNWKVARQRLDILRASFIKAPSR